MFYFSKIKLMDYQEQDQQYVWHPFTQHQTAAPSIAIVRGKGAYLYDEHGTAYLDAVSSWWTNLHGHAHPYLANALYAQANTLEHVIFANFTHPPAIQLAKRLLAHLPHFGKVFYSDNGSTAVEVALKMAIQYWYNQGSSRKKIVALENAYHGDTFGAMSVGARDGFNVPFEPYFFDVTFIPAPYPGQEEACFEAFRAIASEGDVAALIVEPLVQGSAGMLCYSEQSLQQLFGLAKSSGCLIIADEVMTGFGRTGKWWATAGIEPQPDIISLSKGITGGTMALGVTVCTDEIYNAFLSEEKHKTFFHGHSYTANPLACAVANASLDLLERPETWANIAQIVTQHGAFLDRVKGSFGDKIADARQCGTIVAITLQTPNGTSYFSNLRDRIWTYFLSRGLLLRPLGNIIYILPPYCITTEELERVYSTIADFLVDYILE